MKNIIKGLILLIIIVGLSLLMPGLMDSTKYDVLAGEAEWSDDEIQDGVDKFTVVEIVPYEGLDEIGYLVGGQEPIDQDLMDIGSASGQLSFLGDAINVYPSYEEKLSAAFGTADSGWRPAKEEINQNGYFENVGHSNGGYYTLNSNVTRYDRVADGTGTYAAVLTEGTDMDACYTLWGDTTNKRNVNAYFVLGKPTGVNIFNASFGYAPFSVTKNPTHNGDYDYNVSTKSFYLNQGNGKYDVIFTRAYSGNLYYIMKDSLKIVDDGTGTYSFPLSYVAKAAGNYVRLQNVQNMIFDQWNGPYRFVQDNAALTKPSNYYTEGSKIWVRNQKLTVSIQYHYKVQLVNNEWFKTLTLGIPADMIEDYQVDVIAIKPEDLNQSIIDEADLFYINTKVHNNSYITLYETYNEIGISQPAVEANLNFAIHDLSWDNVNSIFKRAAGIGCNKAAMIFDDTYYQDAVKGQGAYERLYKQITLPNSYSDGKATMCNLAKLYIMVYQRNMIDFYNSFMQTDNPLLQTKLITKQATTINLTGYTGSFVRPDMTVSPTADAALYWNAGTFLPYGLNENGQMVNLTTKSYDPDALVAHGIVNYNITATPTDLTNNVLSLNGSDFFTSKFIQPISIPSDSQNEATEQLSTVNADGTVTSPTSFNLGDMLNVITDEGIGYEDVGGVSYPGGSVVEGPPAEAPDEGTGEIVDEGTDGSGIRSYKRVLNIQPTADFTSSETTIRTLLSDFDVQIINMTSMQYNSSIEDINSMYDMIFMGSGAGRFNWSTASNPTTVFNTTALNGSYYFATGDKRLIKDNNRQLQYYRGNDLTTQKILELNNFLDAGYPIVLDSNMYTPTGIAYSVNLKAFITTAKKQEHPANFLNTADYTSTTPSIKLIFKTRLKTALNVVRPQINLITPLVADDATNKYIYVDPVTDLLTIKFSILPKGVYPSTYTYDAYLYMDDNGDGIFDATEKLDVVSSDGSSTIGLSESRYRTYTYNYNIGGYNGVYQWKLVVERHANNNIHSNVTGYTANSKSSKEVIRILHIRDNSSTYSLQSKINDAASLIYQYAGENALKDYRLDIKTMTVNEFNQLYVTQHYTTATASTTNKLSGYHMLIMDNPVSAISATYGARTNIYDEIGKNLSVIFTKNALNYDNQGFYYSSTKSSYQIELTYNFLNLNAFKGSSTYYIYNSLATNGNGDLSDLINYQTTYLTKTNEGTIARYPYQINQAIRNATNSFSDYVTLDFNPSSKKLIGWYCLSDTKSPLIRDTFTTGVSDANLYKGFYSSSPNDVKNNYYLFSNGLCYYSGITLNTTTDKVGNDDEIKLFVNTIIAAYEATNRIVSTPAVITITDPDPGPTNTINITESDIVNDEFILTFNIDYSSSLMSMVVRLNGAEAAGSWDDTIYKVTGSTIGPPITIDTTDKVVENSSYIIKIPVTSLVMTNPNVLTLTVTNVEGNITTKDVTLIYVQKPVVKIEVPEPLTNASKGYLYVDIDYNALDTDEGYLDTAEDLVVVFSVTKSVTDFNLDIFSGVEDLTDGTGYDVTVTDEAGTAVDFTQTCSKDITRYTMYIPVALMKDHSSREIVITATDSFGNSGQASVTLLRRSLFPLD